MQRVLGHGSFLRFYLLLGLALCVIFFIALVGRSFIEQVRREDYREQLAALPMSLMTHQLAALPPMEREAAAAHFSDQLNMQLSLQRIEDAELGYFTRARIERGSVVVTESPWRLRQRLPDDEWMLNASLSAWSEQQWQGSMLLLGEWLRGMPSEARAEALAQLSSGSWPLTLHFSQPAGLLPGQQAQLDSGEVLIRLVSEQLSLTLLYKIPGESQWLQAGPTAKVIASLALAFNL